MAQRLLRVLQRRCGAASVASWAASPALCDEERLISAEELASNDFTPVGEGGSGRLWVSYKSEVFDVTDFAQSHPGGLSNLQMAAGGAIDPFWKHWSVHVQHPSAALPILRRYKIGRLAEEEEEDDEDDPFADEPARPGLGAGLLTPLQEGTGTSARGPFEAECEVPGDSFLTPNDGFYVRNHAPVPPADMASLAVGAVGGASSTVSLEALQAGTFGAVRTIAVTIQCSGNRLREADRAIGGVNGWTGRGSGYGLVSTATFTGVRLADVLERSGALIGAKDDMHVECVGRDGYVNSIPLARARDATKDVLLAWAMNGADMPRDHGAPLRLVVPGVVGARQVKWLASVRLLPSRSDAPWQRTFYTMPDGAPISHWPICSAVTRYDAAARNVRGFAYAGDGAGVASVDVSFDDGATWAPATLEAPDVADAANWAWRLWRADVPPSAMDDGVLRCRVRATDGAGVSQPADPEAALAHMPKGYLFNPHHRVALDARTSSTCNHCN